MVAPLLLLLLHGLLLSSLLPLLPPLSPLPSLFHSPLFSSPALLAHSLCFFSFQTRRFWAYGIEVDDKVIDINGKRPTSVDSLCAMLQDTTGNQSSPLLLPPASCLLPPASSTSSFFPLLIQRLSILA